MATDPIPFRPRELIAAVQNTLEPAAHEKGLRLHGILPDELDQPLLGDAEALRRILRTLVSNAIRFTRHGEVRIQASMRACKTQRTQLRIEVTDTGAGIPAERLDSLFAPAQSADGQVSSHCGLPACKRLINQMGGHMGVNSLEGLGSLFWIQLKLMRAAEAPAEGVERGPLRDLHLLYVDDSKINLEVGELLLIQEGARVTLASNGQQALEILSRPEPTFDAVLMDVQMPDLDGLAVTRLIRAQPAHNAIPILALTAGLLPGQRAEAIAAGMNAVLAKPLDIDELIETLRPGLSRSPTTRAVPTHPATLDQSGKRSGIEVARMTARLGGDSELFGTLLKLFIAESQQHLNEARQALEQADRTSAARALHGLRGDASVIGALGVAATAGQLEQAIRKEDTALDESFESIARQLDALRRIPNGRDLAIMSADGEE